MISDFLLIVLFLSACLSSFASAVESHSVASPNEQVRATVDITDSGACELSVTFHGKVVIRNSPLGLALRRGEVLTGNTDVRVASRNSTAGSWRPLWGKRSEVTDSYNEMTLDFTSADLPTVGVIVRAYDDGVAFRYSLGEAWEKFEINSEKTTFRFETDADVWAANFGGFKSPQESEFLPSKISKLDPKQIYGCPLLVKIDADTWTAFTEANLTDWAGMHFRPEAEDYSNDIHVVLAPHPDEPEVAVRSKGPRVSPWRVLMLGDRPGDLVESDLIRNLNEPAEGDFSWVTPGKCTWDWWSAGYVPDADYEVGMNTDTMKALVDLAVELGAKYQLVDWKWYGPPFAEGAENTTWSVNPNADITKSVPEIDIPELVQYGKERGIGIILWTQWQSIDKQMDEAFPLYEKWGVKGVKIDFMDRDDQEMVNFYHRVVRKAAEHHLIVDFHGAYKPTGVSRTWPNLITREGVLGNEYNKWSNRITPEHTVTIPFTRGLFGEMDFTPGGFRNKSEETFRPQDKGPFVMGTRVHQLAMLVVYESALQVLCDSPYNYHSAPAGLDFIKLVPTTWDDTLCLHGEVGDYITVARRSGDDWYVASMTDNTARELEIPLDFLGEGSYRAEIWADAYEAEDFPDRLMKSQRTLTKGDIITARMARGGGHIVRLAPVE